MNASVLYGGPIAGPYDVYSEVETAAGRTPLSKAAWSSALLFGRAGSFSTRAELLADSTQLSYSIVSEGDMTSARDGTAFEVAASDATDHHATTAGGVKLYEAGTFFSTKARLKAAIARGRTWAAQTVLVAAGLAYITPASGAVGSITDLELVNAVPHLTQMDAAGDGTTDDRTKLAVAFASRVGAALRVDDESTFRVPMTAAQTWPLPDGLNIEGGYLSKIKLEATGAGTTLMMGDSDDMRISGVTFEADHASSGETLQIFRAASRNLIYNNVFSGGVDDAGGTPSHVAHVMDLGSINSSGGRFVGNFVTGFTRVALKNNAAATSHRDWLFAFNSFTEMSGESLPINSPNGIAYGFRVIGNYSANNFGDDVGNSAHSFGGAGVRGAVIMGNAHGEGKGDEVVHFEDGSSISVGIGNTGYFTTARAGIQISDYNASGSWRESTKLSIVANAVQRATRAGGVAGLDAVYGTTGAKPMTLTVFANNVASGWEKAARYGLNGHTNIWTANILHDSDEGFGIAHPSFATHGNMIVDNDAPLGFRTSGMIGPQFYASETTWNGTSVFIPAATVDTGHVGGDEGFARTAPGVTIAGAATNYPLMPLGNWLDGEITVFVGKSDTIYREVTARITWDGVNDRLTEVVRQENGSGITFVDFRDDGSGNLAIRLNSGASQTNCHFQVRFTGSRGYE